MGVGVVARRNLAYQADAAGFALLLNLDVQVVAASLVQEVPGGVLLPLCPHPCRHRCEGTVEDEAADQSRETHFFGTLQ